MSGFLENRDKPWEQSDTESTEWEAFLDKWIDVFGNEPIAPKALVYSIESAGSFRHEIAGVIPYQILDAVFGKGDKYSRIGFQFRSRLGKRYGLRGLRLEKGKRTNSGITWTVSEDKIPDSCRVGFRPYTNFDPDLSSNDNISVGCVGLNTPNAESKNCNNESNADLSSNENDDMCNVKKLNSAQNPTHPTHPTRFPSTVDFNDMDYVDIDADLPDICLLA